MPSFFDKIKNNEVKTPTQKGFSLKKWNKCWDAVKAEASTRDQKLHLAGYIIFNLLEEIRNKLKSLYMEQAPDISNVQLLMAYVSLSNRNRAIMSSKFPSKKNKSQNTNLHSVTLSNNSAGNEITLQEISDGAVDGLEKAIFLCKTRINKSEEIAKGENPIGIMEFISKENQLSQLYDTYENYWHEILWNNFDLIEINRENKLYMIIQPMDQYEIGAYVSQIRKSRLGAQSAMIATSPDILRFYDKDKYVSIVKNGRRKKLVCKSIKNSNDKIKAINSDWKTNTMLLVDNFGTDILSTQNNISFSINEALEVFRNLIILSVIFANKYPNNFNVFNLKKLLEFCPKVSKVELQLTMNKSTGISIDKIRKILEFLEYEADKNQDLWCHPVIVVSPQQYALVTSSLVAPVILRVVEHWLVSLNIELQDKGLVYEKLIIDGMNSALNENTTILDFNRAISRRIKLTNAEEEIDLILRIGNLILIGEAKSIVTTDSPISNYRSLTTLKNAAKQVKRKTEFVQNNLEAIFQNLNWKYDCNTEYKFSNCIINSGRMYVGFDIDGIPVCDEKVLLKYFQECEVPIASTFDKDNKKAKHLAWVTLYSNFDELKKNLSTYLSNPPQIFEREKHFEYKTITLPYQTEDSYKIIFKRFIPKEIAVKDRVEIEHSFPIGKIDNYDEEIKKIDFIV